MKNKPKFKLFEDALCNGKLVKVVAYNSNTDRYTCKNLYPVQSLFECQSEALQKTKSNR